MKSLICLAAMLAGCVTAFAQDNGAAAAMKPALAEAHCPQVRKGTAERAAICLAVAQRKVWAEHFRDSLEIADACLGAQISGARKLDAGTISARQFHAETKARTYELTAKLMAKARENQCNSIIKALANPWGSEMPALQALLIEKARNLRL